MTAVVVLFVLVVAVLVVDAIGYALYSRQPATSESFLVRSPIRYAWLGAVGLVVSASMLLTDHSFWAMDYFIMALLAVSLVLSALSLPGLWELRVEGDDLAQNREDFFPNLGLHINVLQAAQQARNVVAREGVQLNGGNVHDTEG